MRGGGLTPIMGLLDDRLLAGSLAGLVLSIGLLVGVVGYIGVLTVAAIVPGGSGVDALLGAVIPAALATAVLVATFLLSAIGLAMSVGRRLSVPRSRRAADAVARVERYSDRLAAVGLSETLAPPEPSIEERVAALKRRYVDGDLTEREFERELRAVVAEEPAATATDINVGAVGEDTSTWERDQDGERDPA